MPSGSRKELLESGWLPKDEGDVLSETWNVVPRKRYGSQTDHRKEKKRLTERARRKRIKTYSRDIARRRASTNDFKDTNYKQWKPWELKLLTMDLTVRELAYTLRRSYVGVSEKIFRINHALKDRKFVEHCRKNPGEPWQGVRTKGFRKTESLLYFQYFVSVCELDGDTFRYTSRSNKDSKTRQRAEGR